MITRFGGDEFVVLQAGTERYQDAKWLAQRLAGHQDPFDIDGHRIDVGPRRYRHGAHGWRRCRPALKKADMALYAPNGGGAIIGSSLWRWNRRHRNDGPRARPARSFVVEEFERLSSHWSIRTGRVTTCEALLRWSHPTRGMVPPSVFIPIAEETGLIIALGEWALHRACLEAVKWPKSVKVAVNLSPVQFRDRGLALQVVSALAKSGLPAQRLELEVTERLLLEDSDGTLAVMEQLKNLGVGISLDDFGTGYSSLNYLRTFPFHKIKIDQSFIRGLGGQERDAQAIIGAVAGLGASLDKIVVAEGIETEVQMRQVKAHGCHEGQGHFFGEPMTADVIRARLEASTTLAQLVA